MPSVEPRSRRSICRTLVFVTLRSFLVSTSSVVKKLAFIAVAAAILIGCDTAPGLVEPVNRLPNVSALEVTPGLVDLDEDPSYLEDDLVRIPVSIGVDVTAPEARVASVRFVVRLPYQTTQTMAEGELLPAADGRRYGLNFQLLLPRGMVGDYPVVVYAVDERGNISNRATAMLRYRATGEPPVIEEVIVPERIQRPASGTSPVKFVAVVSDPDGLENIDSVEFWNVANPASRVRMYDTGQGGDDVAGDGRYTVTINISANEPVATHRFQFVARDLTGQTSDIIEREVSVE